MAFLDEIRRVLGGGGVNALMGAGRIAGAIDPTIQGFHGINSIVGLGKGFLNGGKPRVRGGKLYFENMGENTAPQASGDVMLLPRRFEDASPTELAHESRHQEQSRSLGPAYSAIASLGDAAAGVKGAYLNPLEVDAYKRQPAGRETENDKKIIRSIAQSPIEKFFANWS